MSEIWFEFLANDEYVRLEIIALGIPGNEW